MATAPESRITNAVRKAILSAWPGAVLWKIHGGPFQRAGLPDLMGCIEGRFVGIEIKRPGDPHPLSPLQEHTLRAITAAGGVALVAHSVEEALRLLEETS